MVLVQPLHFVSTQQAVVDAAGVNGAQRERFEFEEITELLVHRSGHVQHQVFNPHAPFASPVQTRLDRCDHAGLHRHVGVGNGFGNALRSFVHIQEVADAVAGTVAVVHALLPQRSTGQRIQHGRQRAQRETRAGQRQRALEHQRVVALLRGSRRANRPDAGDVGGAAQILAAGVNQQQAVAFDHGMVLGSGAVMRHCAIGVEARNRVEAQTDKARAFGTCCAQFLVDCQFGNALLAQRRFKPCVELAHRRAVLCHRVADMRGLRRIFAALE